MQVPNATLLSSKRKLSLPLDNLLIGASTSSHDQQAGPVLKRTRTQEAVRGGKTYSLLGPAPSADSHTPDVFPFMFTSTRSPDRISIPLHNISPSTRIHPSLPETEDIPGPSSVIASSRALLKDIWNGLRLFCSNFDTKKYIFVPLLLKNIAMRNVFTLHTRLSNIFYAAPAASDSVSKAVISESNWNDAGIQAKSSSSETTRDSNRSPPSSPTTPTGTPNQRMHDKESDSMPGLAASNPNCVNVASDPSLTRTGDKGRSSNVDANIHYLQAEIECLIRHEVKTMGMQTHFRNLLNAPGSDLHDILQGIYTLDEPELRRSGRVLVGNHVYLEIGSVSQKMVDPIAISIRVENSSCPVDIRV